MILDFDPSLQKVQEYLNSVKAHALPCCGIAAYPSVSLKDDLHFPCQEFLRDRRALDLLYSYEACTLQQLATVEVAS